MSRHDETKTIKPVINDSFVTSSGDILTDYNDSYCLFTMSAFVIGGTTSTTLHFSKLTFESSVTETYLQAVSQKHQTVLVSLELLHFIETVFEQPVL